ncbi:MAG: tetratricopeptide repeat protein [Ignavibacteriales bacterium]|nr:tetratricopeptide repeat protein [Ignavibacteriales bacterium]
MIKCKVCGEEINYEVKFCPQCGVAVKSKNDKQHLNKEENNILSKFSKTKKNIQKEKNKKASHQENLVRTFSSTKLIYLILFLLVACGVIIYSSGIFDSLASITSTQFNDKNNPHAGVDLNNLEQINSYEETLKKNPGDKETLLHLAHLLNDSGLKTKAIERYNDYLKHDPKNADVLVDMGVCYYETGKNNEAIAAMEKALTYQPRHQIAHLNLGVVNMTAGNSVKAIEWWKKAVEIDPTSEIGKKAEELIKTH